jgi:hypothetical protein
MQRAEYAACPKNSLRSVLSSVRNAAVAISCALAYALYGLWLCSVFYSFESTLVRWTPYNAQSGKLMNKFYGVDLSLVNEAVTSVRLLVLWGPMLRVLQDSRS